MQRKQAEALAAIYGGEAFVRRPATTGGTAAHAIGAHTADDFHWIVTHERDDGAVIVFDHDGITHYASYADFDNNRPSPDPSAAPGTITLDEVTERWVIVEVSRTSEPTIFYLHPDLQLGWPDEHTAHHEARALTSRTGKRYDVCREEDL